MDWGVVLVLAAVTWLEGVRRVPTGALVIRRALGGPWTVADPADPARTWRLVAWWSPLTLALVVPPRPTPDADSPAPTDVALDARLDRARPTLVALRALGAAVLLGIVVGVPAAVARFGAWGFAGGLAAVLLLTLATAALTFRGVRALGEGRWHAARLVAPLLWPFSAPRAPELLLERAVAGASPLMVARRLLGESSFAAWVRPQAYDALSDESKDGAAAVLLTLLGRPALASIVHAAPAGCRPGESFCGRCARTYRAGMTTCADCGVALGAV